MEDGIIKKRLYDEFEDDFDLTHRQKKLRYLKTRRNFRKVQIIMSRFRLFARILATIVLIIAIIKVGNLPQWYLNPSVFHSYPNKYLEIRGNEVVTTRQIMTRLAKVKLPRKPIYMLSVDPIKKELEKITPIKEVDTRRFWFPARLAIHIEERNPLLSITPNPQTTPIAVITDDSTIIEGEFLPLRSSKKTYTVLTYADFYKWSPRQVHYLDFLCMLYEEYSNEKVKYLDIRNPDDVYVQLDTVKIRLGDLNSTVFARSKRISSVLPQTQKINEPIEYIDLRWDNSTFIKLKESRKDVIGINASAAPQNLTDNSTEQPKANENSMTNLMPQKPVMKTSSESLPDKQQSLEIPKKIESVN